MAGEWSSEVGCEGDGEARQLGSCRASGLLWASMRGGAK
jgi:hypothetical protein